ncbi:MAG: adenylate/guanylate cyclase domain-containing protein [Bacteroidales bacterium]|jgi:adenylate cyclase|nr:adenylate/guanylate cyclase domain-containing protein [Bacteroidales bacterium]
MKRVNQSQKLFRTLFAETLKNGQTLRSGVFAVLIFCQGIILLLLYIFNREDYYELFISGSSLYAVFLFFIAILIYELITYAYFRLRPKTDDKQQSYELGFWPSMIETSLLSFTIVFIIIATKQFIILFSPFALNYFVLIILSSLRLNYKLPVFTGIMAAAQYVALAVIFQYQDFVIISNPSGIKQIQFLGFGLGLIIAGIAGGFVTKFTMQKVQQAFDALLEKRKVEFLFGQQISKPIANVLLNAGELLQSKKTKVSVMFMDIRGFTELTRRKSPEEIVGYLNQLFAFMIDIVQSKGGVINQFLGDGFMATFGAPIADDNSRQNAVEAALEIYQKLQELNKNKSIIPTSIGIGIHYGVAVTGNIGTVDRMQYSITGKVVIISSRIEQLNKQLDTQILISYEVLKGLKKETSRFYFAGSFLLKGISRAIKIFGVK